MNCSLSPGPFPLRSNFIDVHVVLKVRKKLLEMWSRLKNLLQDLFCTVTKYSYKK